MCPLNKQISYRNSILASKRARAVRFFVHSVCTLPSKASWPSYSRIFAMVLLICLTWPAMADEVRVAVAANFIAPMQKISPKFERATGHRVILSFGSTGKFYSQIRNGAPFDVLLAADTETPSKLEAENHAVAGSRFTYATGKLVLWSAMPGIVDNTGEILRHGNFRHIALTNPKLAPYGAASIETLRALGSYEKLKNQIVLGENLTQTHQYIVSRNAELGFLSMSQIYRDGKFITGSHWTVPENLYSPIRQDAIILKQGTGKPAADAFMKYLKSPKSKAIIRSYGYNT